MKEKFKPTLMANYMLWPAANLINFAFCPPSQRILYCNVVYVSIRHAHATYYTVHSVCFSLSGLQLDLQLAFAIPPTHVQLPALTCMQRKSASCGQRGQHHLNVCVW